MGWGWDGDGDGDGHSSKRVEEMWCLTYLPKPACSDYAALAFLDDACMHACMT